MPTLDWIGKAAVVHHHRKVGYHLLRCDRELSAGDADAGNLLVQGDNLLALKALLPYYAGKVKCIYIDPPYNTGNENWVYNDNVNSPEIRQWIKATVGKEGEDLSRHDKWLCMMYPRLALLRDFLTEDGAIFVSIDDTEAHRLRMLMDEIFGAGKWICTLIWKRRQTPDSRNLNGVSVDHEYVLCYGRTSAVRFRGQEKDLTKYTNPDNDPNGPWMSDNLTGLANATERPNLHYEIVNPSDGRHYPPHPSRGWIYGRDRMADLIAQGRILWPKSATGRPRLKRYATDMRSEFTGFSTMLAADANVVGTKELAEVLGPKVFPFPKPRDLMRTVIQQTTSGNDIVMDSFTGSGTTAHAVLAQNKADGGNRRFITVEMDETICRDVTAQRIRKAIEGYGEGDKATPGLGGGFRFCKLGAGLFDDAGNIAGEVKFTDLAAHVFFTETGVPIPKRAKADCPLLGVHNGKAVYLLFNGVLGDKRPAGGNVLTHCVAQDLPAHPNGSGPRVVYGEACRLGPKSLEQYGMTFRQVPFELKVD
ncbi:MAG: site-specific DNA-methyltransferase [Pirellulales bacterium]|nr:site-specific DNA-methyltransferase [Pirellulales bacterium]